MKMKLVLLTISAAALAVSADCQAMMRRAPAKVGMPKAVAPKVLQRSFSFKKVLPNDVAEIVTKVKKDNEDRKYHQALKEIRENQFPLPEVPRQTEKIFGISWKTKERWNIDFKHWGLTCDWYFANKKLLESKKELRNEALKMAATVVLPVSTGGLFFVAPEEVTGSLFVWTALFSLARIGFRGEDFYDAIKEVKAKKNKKMTVEAELAELVKEQKRELKLRDDIQ